MPAITKGYKIKRPALRNSFILLVVGLVLSIPGPLFSSDYTGHISFTSGGLITDQKFSKAFNIDTKYELGISFDVIKNDWPVSIAFDYSFLYAESETFLNQENLEENKKVSFLRSDTCLGVKKIFNASSVVKPFIGSGLYFVRIYGKLADDREMATSLGYWFGAGIYFELPKDLTLGFLWKKSTADIKIFDIKSNAGGKHFSLITGFHF